MSSLMLDEVRETPTLVAAQLAADSEAYAALAAALGAAPPVFAATIARGSSDHAAAYAATLLALAAGLATASLPPSLVSRYGVKLALDRAFVVGLSQSGASPDLVASMQAASASGAVTAAIVNQPGSALAEASGHVLPQRAGAERSVAATKSFILTLVAIARLIAVWRGDQALMAGLERLPERLEAALAVDWGSTVESLAEASSLYVLGRGPALAIANEAALKLKETSYLHAEAFSSAEVRHGPRAVIDDGFPLLAIALADAGGADTAAFAAEMAAAGGTVITASPDPKVAGLAVRLPEPLHPLLDPIVAIAAFYPMAAALAVARGHDPDRPRGLKKVTSTV